MFYLSFPYYILIIQCSLCRDPPPLSKNQRRSGGGGGGLYIGCNNDEQLRPQGAFPTSKAREKRPGDEVERWRLKKPLQSE